MPLPKRVPIWVLLTALFGSVIVAVFTPMPYQLWWDAISLAVAIWLTLRFVMWWRDRRHTPDYHRSGIIVPLGEGNDMSTAPAQEEATGITCAICGVPLVHEKCPICAVPHEFLPYEAGSAHHWCKVCGLDEGDTRAHHESATA